MTSKWLRRPNGVDVSEIIGARDDHQRLRLRDMQRGLTPRILAVFWLYGTAMAGCMGLLWDCYGAAMGNAMGLLWGCYGQCYGSAMGLTCACHGTAMGLLWGYYGAAMGLIYRL